MSTLTGEGRKVCWYKPWTWVNVRDRQVENLLKGQSQAIQDHAIAMMDMADTITGVLGCCRRSLPSLVNTLVDEYKKLIRAIKERDGFVNQCKVEAAEQNRKITEANELIKELLAKLHAVTVGEVDKCNCAEFMCCPECRDRKLNAGGVEIPK